MDFAFVRLEKIAEDVSATYGRVVPLEEVVSACQELEIPTSPIDLGDGRAALLCETKHEENLKDLFHSKLAIEEAAELVDPKPEESSFPSAAFGELNDRLEAVELRSVETNLMQKRINIVLAKLEKRIGTLEAAYLKNVSEKE